MVTRWKLALMGLSVTVFSICPLTCAAAGAVAVGAASLINDQPSAESKSVGDSREAVDEAVDSVAEPTAQGDFWDLIITEAAQ